MDGGAVLEGPEGVRQGGEVQACGEAHEAAAHVLDVPFDGGGGLGLDAAEEGGHPGGPTELGVGGLLADEGDQVIGNIQGDNHREPLCFKRGVARTIVAKGVVLLCDKAPMQGASGRVAGV